MGNRKDRIENYLVLLVCVTCLSAISIAIGINVLNSMFWTVYNGDWKEWFGDAWHLTTFSEVNIWVSWVFYGLLPFGLGCFFFGICMACVSWLLYQNLVKKN